MHPYREPRFPTSFPLHVATETGLCQVKVLDVSRSGAKFEGLRGVGVGAALRIPSQSGRTTAWVRWIKDGMAGVAFQPGPVPVEIGVAGHAFARPSEPDASKLAPPIRIAV